ncbi:hypothetical protein NQZ68_008258 [Dissostichus eleginoides]|nr:hypothetical protein NQZ68_008258 [Dissostichus eleginoides]
MELKEKIPHARFTPSPTQGAPMFFLLSFPPPPKSQWCQLFVWRDEQTNMAVLGKGTETDMPVVEATGKAQDTTECIPNLVFLLLPLLTPKKRSKYSPLVSEQIITRLTRVQFKPFVYEFGNC